MSDLLPAHIRGAVKETGRPVSMDERPVHGGDRARPRPSDVQTDGLAEVLADMIISALSWEDVHGIQADRDNNDKDVTGPRPAGVMSTPVWPVPGQGRPGCPGR